MTDESKYNLGSITGISGFIACFFLVENKKMEQVREDIEKQIKKLK